MMKEALRLEHVSKNYRDFALQDICLSLPAGSIMGFIGENGAGKSTTMKALLGLIGRDSGKVYIDGKEFTGEEREIKEHIGVVLDSSCFSEELTGAEIDKIMKRLYKTWDSRKYREFLEQFKIQTDKKIKTYSRGMKMKLSMAVALSHDSKLLILDEATSALDPVVRDSLLDLFMEFIQDETHSILISSHILSDLEKICDYITFIHNGKILFSESKDELLEKYRIAKGSRLQLEDLEETSIVGIKKNAFGAEALVLAKSVPSGMLSDPAGIEDIMLYMVKGEEK